MSSQPLPPLTLAGTIDRTAVVRATELLVDLVADPRVEQRWTSESACAGMSVGALTWHLVNQPQRVVEVLPVAGTDPVSLDEHYARSAWVNEDLDGPANVGVRSKGEDQAEAGPQAALDAARVALAALPATIAAAGDVVALSWTTWTLRTDDFLASRLMEIVVHSDDLAASLDLPAPAFPAEVLTPVLALLTNLALRRHGQDALVRTLTRPQRAPESIAAF